jgi:two-component system chemotaxis sensor kinase CheA
MNEFLEQFVIESRELIEQATADLLAIEQAPEDKAHLDSVFRAFHTLKGAAGIVDFLAMGRVLHAAESILVAVRSGDQPMTADLLGDCLECLDAVVGWLDAIETSGDLPPVQASVADALVARFERASGVAIVPGPEIGEPAWLDALRAAHPAEAGRARLALRYVPDADCFFRGDDPLALVGRVPGLIVLEVMPRQPWAPLEGFDPFACNLVFLALTTGEPGETNEVFRLVGDQVQMRPLVPETARALPADAVALLQAQRLLLAVPANDGFAGRFGSAARVAANVLGACGWTAEAGAIAAAENSAALVAALDAILQPAQPPAAAPLTTKEEAVDRAARALRVDVGRIDTLVKLTGELTVVKNAVGHAVRLAENNAAARAVAQALKDQHALLDRLVGELQRSVLSIRVLPLRHVFQRFPRLVREMAQNLGKAARLITEGEATEADKTVVEVLFEPLLHVVRNALDHGIETPARREAAGKPAIATLRLRAAREGEHVIVELTDDGGGVDVARVRHIAAGRGIASVQTLAEMTDDEAVALIFAPGFSTATTVTDVSGRGVGMDAVRTSIAQIGGQVTIASRRGEGTSIRFTLPFTVMMSRVMAVKAGDQAFGVPFESVIETLRLPRDRIARVGAAEAFVLRDRTVPLVRLADVLGIPAARDAAAREAKIVVTSVSGELGALEVDGFGDRLDVMLKPMEGLLAGMPGIAGTTLLGDGQVLIVLDLVDLLQ